MKQNLILPFIYKIIIIAIGLLIFCGIPYLFNADWLFWLSWMPATISALYLDDLY